jgi:hypothetical protein
MLAQMSQRERTLALVVGGVVALLVNVVVIKFFINQHKAQSAAIATTKSKIEALNKRETERTLWAERDAWLTANLPTLGDDQVANRELGNLIKEIAQKHSVTLESPNPGVPSRGQPTHISLPYKLSAKAPWTPMFEFLRELQAPGKFIVFNPLSLKVDSADKTQLRAELTVAKWFAPQGTGTPGRP